MQPRRTDNQFDERSAVDLCRRFFLATEALQKETHSPLELWVLAVWPLLKSIALYNTAEVSVKGYNLIFSKLKRVPVVRVFQIYKHKSSDFFLTRRGIIGYVCFFIHEIARLHEVTEICSSRLMSEVGIAFVLMEGTTCSCPDAQVPQMENPESARIVRRANSGCSFYLISLRHRY